MNCCYLTKFALSSLSFFVNLKSTQKFNFGTARHSHTDSQRIESRFEDTTLADGKIRKFLFFGDEY